MLCENAMKNVLMELVDETARSFHFIDAKKSDIPMIKKTLLNGLKDRLKKKYNEELDDAYIAAYLGTYLDDVANEIVKNEVVKESTEISECDSFSTGVSGPLGLDNGIPCGGDGKGVVAKPLFTKSNKKKKKYKVVVAKRDN